MKAMLAGMMACITMLAGCGERTGPKNDGSAGAVPEVTGGDACKSLEPLLASLPFDEQIAGAPQTFRGCVVQDGRANVVALYATPDFSTSFSYNAILINENSPYGKAFLGAEESMLAGVDIFALRVGLAGDIFRKRMKECKDAFNSPAQIKPLITTVAGLETCIAGLQDNGKPKMQAFAIHGDVGYEMIMDRPGITQGMDPVDTLRLVSPYFGKFKPQAVK